MAGDGLERGLNGKSRQPAHIKRKESEQDFQSILGTTTTLGARNPVPLNRVKHRSINKPCHVGLRPLALEANAP